MDVIKKIIMRNEQEDLNRLILDLFKLSLQNYILKFHRLHYKQIPSCVMGRSFTPILYTFNKNICIIFVFRIT